jgi:ABC-type branched-subunit amino acid transport system ATPase component/branched-subunit amino acid ABC-type transport system permease component
VTTYLQFLLLGLGSGAVFAALAMALVLTYRSSGVINFATGAIAMFTAYSYASLRNGKLLVPIPGLPSTVTITGSMGFLPAAAIALVEVGILGLLLYLVVFRPLRNAPDVARAVASLGVMAVIQAVMVDRVGSSPLNVGSIFPSSTISIGSIRVPQDRLWFTLVIVLLACLLASGYRFTRFGTATRAVAASEKGAFVSGISPTSIGAGNSIVSAVVCGIAGILIAPIVAPLPLTYTLFIVPALAAAVTARFDSLVIAVAVGLLIGVVQSLVQYVTAQHSWLPQVGTVDFVPLILILGILLFRAKALPGRGEMQRRSLGHAPRPRSLLLPSVVGLIAVGVSLVIAHGTLRDAIITSLVLAIVTLSMVVVTGYAGQVSLAQLTLAGVSGFLLSDLTTKAGVPFPIAPLLAALGATAIGLVIGLPSLRIRGLSIAVVTLAFAVTVQDVWFNNLDLNGGPAGAHVTGPTLFGLDLSAGAGKAFPRLSFALLCLVTTTLVALGVALLRRSRLGSDMLAIRANERSAAAAGVNVVRVKLLAFGSGAFIAGIGGAMMGYQQTVVDSTQFNALIGLGLFAIAYVAGITSVSGGLLAGVLCSGGVLYLGLTHIGSLGVWYDLITGIALILTVILNPEGLVRPLHSWASSRRFSRPVVTASPGAATQEASSEVGLEAVPGRSRATPPEGRDGAPLLQLKELRVSYGGMVAVDDVTLSVSRSAIVGLIGPNGAGKTTLIDAATGFVESTGSVVLNGQAIEGLRPHQRAHAGLVRTFQALELFADLSVEENVIIGAHRTTGQGDSGLAARDLLGLDDIWDRPVAELSQGQRQLVSIARAVAAQPKVLLLDEPAAGLNSSESRWLGEKLRVIRDAGIAILLVDHDVQLVLDLCDAIHVLDLGRTIAEGSPAEVRSDPVVVAAYLGTPPDEAPSESLILR